MTDNITTLAPGAPGRGPGAPTGRRPVVWVCSGIVDSELASEKFIVQDQKPGKDSQGSFPKDVAIAAFEQKHGIAPQTVLGPFFDKRGAQGNKPKKKRLFIDRDNLDDYKFGVERKNAIFGEWRGYVNPVEGYPDKLFFIPIGEATPSGKKRSVPASGLINLSEAEIIEKDQSSQSIDA